MKKLHLFFIVFFSLNFRLAAQFDISNNRRFLLLLLFIVLFFFRQSPVCFGQVTISKEYSKEKTDSFCDLIENNNSIVTISKSYESFFIRRFDYNLNLIESKTIEIPNKNDSKRRELKYLGRINEGLLFVVKDRLKTGHPSYSFSLILVNSDGEARQEIFFTESYIMDASYNFLSDVKYDISPDKKKISVSLMHRGPKNLELYAFLFNNNLEVLKNEKRIVKEKKSAVRGVSVNEDGDMVNTYGNGIYLIKKEYGGYKNFYILNYTGDSFSEYKLTEKMGSLFGVITFFDNKDLKCLYTKIEKGNDGSFFLYLSLLQGNNLKILDRKNIDSLEYNYDLENIIRGDSSVLILGQSYQWGDATVLYRNIFSSVVQGDKIMLVKEIKRNVFAYPAIKGFYKDGDYFIFFNSSTNLEKVISTLNKECFVFYESALNISSGRKQITDSKKMFFNPEVLILAEDKSIYGVSEDGKFFLLLKDTLVYE